MARQKGDSNMATVDVTVTNDRLSATNNPKELLPRSNPGNRQVTWNFIDPAGQGRRLQVEFRVFLPEGGSLPIQHTGPFTAPFPPATDPISGTIDDTARAGLYVYVVH